MSGLFRWVVILVVGTLPAQSARGAIYEFTFGGEITLVDGDVPDLWNDVQVGSMFEVVYTFDSQTPDLNALSTTGVYPIIQMQIQIDGASLLHNEANITVSNSGEPFFDFYAVIFQDMDIGGSGSIFLRSSLDVFQSDALPIDLTLDDFDVNRRFALGLDDLYSIRGHVDQFSARVVPEPASLALVGCALGLLRRRRR